ncbi:MAG: STAS domain-containing protein [Alphaproteobacteria bacterium GM202ARS2]|nr:STAS domain-containing protein [Alphaproteobacteria bacterium GM202ARS2]
MHIHIDTVDTDIVVATPQGSIDCSNADTFGEKFLPLFEQARAVILDGSQLAFITSAGLRVLLTAQQKSTPDKPFILCAINDNIRDVFRVAGLDALFHYADNQEQALEQL